MNYSIYRIHIERPGDSYDLRFFTEEGRAISAAKGWFNCLDASIKKETCVKIYKHMLFKIESDERLVNELNLLFTSIKLGDDNGKEIFRIEGAKL